SASKWASANRIPSGTAGASWPRCAAPSAPNGPCAAAGATLEDASRRDVNAAEFRASLAEKIAAIKRPVAGALVTYALSTPKGRITPPFVTGRWTFWDTSKVARAKSEYSELLLG